MYNYAEQKRHILTDEGQRLFLAVRDKTDRLLNQAGAVRSQEIMMGHAASSWVLMACIDRMVELGEIKEVTSGDVAGQHRVFVSAHHES